MLVLLPLAGLTLLAVPPAADGGGLGVLAIAPPQGPGTELVEIAMQLREMVGELHPDTLDTRALRERMLPPDPSATLARLDRAYADARAAYLRADVAGSARALHAIVDALEPLPDGPERFRQWTRALLRLARCELELGRGGASRDEIERLFGAAPDLEVDGALHPSRFVALTEAVRAGLRSAPRRRLTLSSSLAETVVFVDGREVGKAPAALELAQGRHRVSAAAGELRFGPAQVYLAETDRELLFDFTLPAAMRPAQGPGFEAPEEDPGARILEAGAFLGLDAILAVSLLREQGATHAVGALYDVHRGELVRTGSVRLAGVSLPSGGASALAAFLLEGKASPLVSWPGGPPRSPPPAPPPEPVKPPPRLPVALGKGLLGWTSVGTAVAALGLATFGLVESRAATADYRRAALMRSEGAVTSTAALATYNRYVADGNAASRRATWGWAGAGAGLLATGIAGYVNYRRTGEIGPLRF